MKDYKKNINTIERFVDNEQIKTYIYLSVLIFTVVAYGIFGAISLYKVIIKKAALISRLEQINNQLSSKNEGLKAVAAEITDSRPYIEKAEKLIPNNPNIEEFLTGVVNLASRSGFIQERFFVEQSADNFIMIRASYEGPAAQLASFISSLEEYDRFTFIQSMTYTYMQSGSQLHITYKIYYLKK